jgi:hypothetical protein
VVSLQRDPARQVGIRDHGTHGIAGDPLEILDNVVGGQQQLLQLVSGIGIKRARFIDHDVPPSQPALADDLGVAG